VPERVCWFKSSTQQITLSLGKNYQPRKIDAFILIRERKRNKAVKSQIDPNAKASHTVGKAFSAANCALTNNDLPAAHGKRHAPRYLIIHF
jgi:hypothetical protein